MATKINMWTLPQASQVKAWNLDIVRGLIRKSAALKALGTQFGPTRAYTEAEIETIQAAYAAYEASKGKRELVAV